MGLFTAKTPVLPSNAMIGELGHNGDMVWTIADYDYAWSLYVGDVVELRGSRMVNGMLYTLFYLPPPAHNYHIE